MTRHPQQTQTHNQPMTTTDADADAATTDDSALDFDPDVSIRDPDALSLRNVVPVEDGFEATLHIPGHVHSEVADYVDTLHEENFDSADWVIESFQIDAEPSEPDEVTLAFTGGRHAGATKSFVDDLQGLARQMFADALDARLFDEWRVKRIAVDMDGINVRARFYDPDDAEYMADDHPAFERPPVVDVDPDGPVWGGV